MSRDSRWLVASPVRVGIVVLLALAAALGCSESTVFNPDPIPPQTWTAIATANPFDYELIYAPQTSAVIALGRKAVGDQGRITIYDGTSGSDLLDGFFQFRDGHPLGTTDSLYVVGHTATGGKARRFSQANPLFGDTITLDDAVLGTNPATIENLFSIAGATADEYFAGGANGVIYKIDTASGTLPLTTPNVAPATISGLAGGATPSFWGMAAAADATIFAVGDADALGPVLLRKPSGSGTFTRVDLSTALDRFGAAAPVPSVTLRAVIAASTDQWVAVGDGGTIVMSLGAGVPLNASVAAGQNCHSVYAAIGIGTSDIIVGAENGTLYRLNGDPSTTDFAADTRTSAANITGTITGVAITLDGTNEFLCTADNDGFVDGPGQIWRFIR